MTSVAWCGGTAACRVGSPLSEQILRLEERLGTHVFIRTNRRLMLTEAGRRLQRRSPNWSARAT
ncbi:LysR family transcriptional regulator [Pseudomonas sp. PB120]|uniref:LysR family transcriptional regulator n=1 Tax=Pseudomonas sp. PB120 TaxID=2494700 RepID=UPI0035566424